MRRCAVCRSETHRKWAGNWRIPVSPSGPSPCETLLIGEGPAENEDKNLRPFSGATGKEMDFTYLPIGSLFRPDLGVANAIQCSMPHYRNPTPEEARMCADAHMPKILEQFQPKRIILMGGVACSLATTVRGPIEIERDHGIPTFGQLYDWTGPVLPMYHPSAGMHDSFLMIHLLKDWRRVKDFEAGLDDHWLKGMAKGELDYREAADGPDLWEYLRQGDQLEIAIDTETEAQGFELDALRDPPHCLSLSNRAGTGRAIMAEDRDVLGVLNEWLRSRRPTVDAHNALFDQAVFRRFDPPVDSPWSRVNDTMVRAYHTGWMQQGLKTLAWRELGVRMSDYEDVVKPATSPYQLEWMLRLALAEDIPQPYLKPRQWKLHRKAQSALNALGKDPATDLQKRIKENWVDKAPLDFPTAVEHVGEFPFHSIKYAPRDKMVYYACEDAAVTYQLRPIITGYLTEQRRKAA